MGLVAVIMRMDVHEWNGRSSDELSVYRSRDGFEGFATVSRERKGF